MPPPPVPTGAPTFATSSISAEMEAIRRDGAPAVLVEVRRGDEVWRASRGSRQNSTTEPADPLSAVRIASVTKSMVGTILMQFVAERKIKLDAPISTYLPNLRLGGVPDAASAGATAPPTPTVPAATDQQGQAGASSTPVGAPSIDVDDVRTEQGGVIPHPEKAVTVRMLAQHESGIPDYVNTFDLHNLSEVSRSLHSSHALEDLIGRVRGVPWKFAPGTRYDYSNTNYLILSRMLERASGKSIEELIRERIVDRLKLEATSLPTDEHLPPGAAHGYFTTDNIYLDVTAQNATLWSGAGGVVSTAGDVNSFYRGLMQGSLLKREQLATMLTLSRDGYGIGVQGHRDPCGEAAKDVKAGAATGGDGAGSGGNGAGSGAGQGVPTHDTPGQRAPGQAHASSEPKPAGNEVGQPGMLYGHIGSGLGYRIMSFSSADGMRQATVAWTVSSTDYFNDPRLTDATKLIDAAFTATCGAKP